MNWCWTIAAIIVCGASFAAAAHADLTNFLNGETIRYKGSRLPVFEVDGAHVVQPRITFRKTCDPLRFNYLYNNYEVGLPLSIDTGARRSGQSSSESSHKLVVTSLRVSADKPLADRSRSKISVVAHLSGPKARVSERKARLVFLCDTFTRCRQLQDEVLTNPRQVWRSVQFDLLAQVGSRPVRLRRLRSANLPTIGCRPNRWVVFQRRVDGSLSFAQNWDAYVKGFGDPRSNYWMGLNRLFIMTATGEQIPPYVAKTRCQLRMEAEDFKGKRFWGQWRIFEVGGPDQNYRLRVGGEVPRTQIFDFGYHSGAPFSTYDRDNDRWPKSCSRRFGFGGFWFNKCFTVNPNGAYPTDSEVGNRSPAFLSLKLKLGKKFYPMRRSVMKLKCGKA